MRTTFLKQFGKDIEKIRLDIVKEDIVKVIEQVEEVSRLSEITNLKKLKGYKTAYRIRIGDYRIGVFIDGDMVEFARVVHRREVYRFFP